MKKAGSLGRVALQVFFTGVVYYVATEIAWALCFPNSKVSLLFPPHAVLVVVLLLVPARHWWAYTLATIVAHFIATQQAGWPPLYAIHCEIFDAVQNVLAAAGVRFFIKSPLKGITLRDAIVFVLIAVILVPFGTAFWGAAFTVSNHFGTHYWVEWRDLGISRRSHCGRISSGALVRRDLLVGRRKESHSETPDRGRPFGRGAPDCRQLRLQPGPSRPRGIARLALRPHPLSHLGSATLRIGRNQCGHGAGHAQAIWGAMHGHGPFLQQAPAENALALQMFLLVTGTPLMFLTVRLQDEKRSQQALHEVEERVTLAAEAAHMGVWELNTDTGEMWM